VLFNRLKCRYAVSVCPNATVDAQSAFDRGLSARGWNSWFFGMFRFPAEVSPSPSPFGGAGGNAAIFLQRLRTRAAAGSPIWSALQRSALVIEQPLDVELPRAILTEGPQVPVALVNEGVLGRPNEAAELRERRHLDPPRRARRGSCPGNLRRPRRG